MNKTMTIREIDKADRVMVWSTAFGEGEYMPTTKKAARHAVTTSHEHHFFADTQDGTLQIG